MLIQGAPLAVVAFKVRQHTVLDWRSSRRQAKKKKEQRNVPKREGRSKGEE